MRWNKGSESPPKSRFPKNTENQGKKNNNRGSTRSTLFLLFVFGCLDWLGVAAWRLALARPCLITYRWLRQGLSLHPSFYINPTDQPVLAYALLSGPLLSTYLPWPLPLVAFAH